MSELYLIREFPYESDQREEVEVCVECHALVLATDRATHEAWHRSIEEWMSDL